MPAPALARPRGKRRAPQNPADIGAVRNPYQVTQRVPVLQVPQQQPLSDPATTLVGAEQTRLSQEAARQQVSAAQNAASGGLAALFAQQQQQLTEGLAGQLEMMQQLQAKKEKGGKLGPGGPLPGLPANAEFVGRAHVGNRKLIQHHGVTLAAGAMRSLIAAGRMLGTPIPGGGYRSLEQQKGLQYKKGQGIPVAAPGKSLHEQGLAIDIPTSFLDAHPRLVKILEKLGWNRWNPSVEPWHFSYRKTG